MIDLFKRPKIETPSQQDWFYDLCYRLIPAELEEVISWADKNYRVVNKDRDLFNSSEAPWLIEPLQMADDPLVSRLTYVKPVQCGGGTSLGEIIILRRILDSSGLIGYYWPTDDKAKDRWEKWTERRLKACEAVRARMPKEYENMLIRFANITFSMAGVFNASNLDSDTVDFIIGDEIHQMKAGSIAKMKGRQTKVDFPKLILLSNAGVKGDQLHQEFNEGTQQHFEIKCPGCNKFHIMRTRWEDNHPELGGLRYDSQGCKRNDGTFDYNKLVPTIRFHFPCGYEMPDDVRLRRLAAVQGRYSQPFNTGALLANRSYTLQAVACHTMRWLDLIQEKHIALRALKAGDDTDWRRYLQERESIFYDSLEHRPFEGQIVVTESAQTTREGMPTAIGKLWAADWQQGEKAKSELTHYWLVIESVLASCSSQVIFAGRVADENELLLVLKDHGITDADGGGLVDGFIDASKNTANLKSFAYRAGINLVMGNTSWKGGYRCADGSRQYFSMKKYIYKELSCESKYPRVPFRNEKNELVYIEDPAEPYIVEYNKAGLLRNHFFIREMKENVLKNNPKANPEDYIERIIPGDIGEDYLKHHEAWLRDYTATQKRNQHEVEGFQKVSRADHLMSCTTYIDLLKDLSGLLGNRLTELGIRK